MAAAQQLEQLPEVAEARRLLPLGRAAGSDTASDVACSLAAARMQRATEILSSLPVGAATTAMMQACLRHRVAVGEVCFDPAAALETSRRLVAITAAAPSPPSAASITTTDAAADAGENYLALCRSLMRSASAANSSAALTAALHGLAACEASLSHDRWVLPTATEPQRAVRELPLVLAGARLHVAAAGVSALVQQRKSRAVAPAEPMPTPSPPPGPADLLNPSPPKSKAASPEDHAVDEHLQAAVTLASHLDAAASSLAQHAPWSAHPPVLRLAAFVHAQAAAVRVAARRNVAAGHLFSAVRQGAPASGPAVHVGSRLAAAHTQLEAALAEVDAASAAMAQLTRHGSSSAVCAAMDRLAEDLRRHGVDVRATLCETTLFSGLLAAGWDDNSSSNRGATAPGPLFPLSPDLLDAMTPILRRASEHAHAALKLAEQPQRGDSVVDAAGTGTGGVIEPRTGSSAAAGVGSGVGWGDAGIDTGSGAARPVRLISLLQLVAGRPVVAEGLLRSAVDIQSSLRRLSSASRVGSRSGGGGGSMPPPLETTALELPPLHATQAGATLLTLGALLRQWEKREGQGEVLLLAHGYFNNMIGIALQRRGWKLTQDQGFRYWSVRRFEPRG